MIAIVNYGVGNLASVEKALKKLGFQAEITDAPRRFFQAERVVFPGVGAFGAALENLQKKQLIPVLTELRDKNVPMLGICLGHQLLFSDSEEHGSHQGLDFIPGHVRRFPDTVRIPHMGWNRVEFSTPSPLFEGIPNRTFFYFANSYYSVTEREFTLATTHYGLRFASVAQKGTVFGVQFHPEKSQDAGLQLLENFARKI